MSTFVTVFHIITCVLIVLVVLLQSGKGAEISASFSGSSQTVFGSAGGANFFTRVTAVLAGIFMVTSLFLTWNSGQARRSIFEAGGVPATAATPVPSGAPSGVPSPTGTPLGGSAAPAPAGNQGAAPATNPEQNTIPAGKAAPAAGTPTNAAPVKQ